MSRSQYGTTGKVFTNCVYVKNECSTFNASENLVHFKVVVIDGRKNRRTDLKVLMSPNFAKAWAGDNNGSFIFFEYLSDVKKKVTFICIHGFCRCAVTLTSDIKVK